MTNDRTGLQPDERLVSAKGGDDDGVMLLETATERQSAFD